MMELRQTTPSVIARLMGFDEVQPPLQPACGPHRVLSEDYLQKSDSICLLESRSYRKRRLSKVGNETAQKCFNDVEVQGREKISRNSFDSAQRVRTNPRVGRDDLRYSSSKIVILRPTFGNSKFEILLPFSFAKKANNRLLEKWKSANDPKALSLTRRSITKVENCVLRDELENKVEEGNHDEESSKNYSLSNSFHCTDSEYEQTINKTKAYQNKSTKCNEGYCDFEISEDYVELFSENSGEKHFKPMTCTLDAKDGHFPHILDALIEQEPLSSLSYPKIDSEFHMSAREYFSPSPNSVLGPLLNEEMLSSSDSSDSIGSNPDGLQMLMRISDSKTEDTNSEGPDMVVSSDEDTGDESSNYHENVLRFLRAEESRDSSYVVDVLDEASVFGSDMKFCPKAWYSLDSPLNPLLFELLEKKYSKQLSWEKSERRLLFDCVNSGLKEILYPYMDVYVKTKSLRKSFNMSLSREVIQYELWRLLVSQEKEVSKALSEKALGTETRWFDLRDDTEIIVCEMENVLFDELLSELLCG